MSTLREYFVPCFAAMARRQSAILDLVWPERIDAFLVPDCCDRRGGYSHPLTIDVSHNRGLELCETLLHEITHVGDVYTQSQGGDSLRDRLAAFFLRRGVSEEQGWNIWHAVIFASSADQVRHFIAPARRLYPDSQRVRLSRNVGVAVLVVGLRQPGDGRTDAL